MISPVESRHLVRVGMHPLHALLLGGAMAFFLGTLATDIAYACTYEIQWSNFSSWLLVGGLVLGGLALVCALIGLMPSRRTRFAGLHLLLWLATWVIGFFNALMHARDAWAIMPGAVMMSIATAIVGCLAVLVGLIPRRGGVQ